MVGFNNINSNIGMKMCSTAAGPHVHSLKKLNVEEFHIKRYTSQTVQNNIKKDLGSTTLEFTQFEDPCKVISQTVAL